MGQARLNDSHRRRSDAFAHAMARSAERRQCPKCQRKSAVVRLSRDEDDFISAYCRWEDCGWCRVRPEWNPKEADDGEV